MSPMDAASAQAITLLDWALVALRICAVLAVGGFVAAMVIWRTSIWSDETVGEDGEDAQ